MRGREGRIVRGEGVGGREGKGVEGERLWEVKKGRGREGAASVTKFLRGIDYELSSFLIYSLP